MKTSSSTSGELRKGQEPRGVPRLPAPRDVCQDAGGRHRRLSHSRPGDPEVAQEEAGGRRARRAEPVTRLLRTPKEAEALCSHVRISTATIINPAAVPNSVTKRDSNAT